MVLVGFILIIDALQAATLPGTSQQQVRYWILLFAVFLSRKIGKNAVFRRPEAA